MGLFLFWNSDKAARKLILDDSVVCIVRKKVDNKLTYFPYVSLLCDIATNNLVAKKLGVYLKSEL